MSREHFSFEEERLFKRLLTLKELVAEQVLYEKLPCPLLAEQLNELGVICGKLQTDIQSLAECVDKAIAS